MKNSYNVDLKEINISKLRDVVNIEYLLKGYIILKTDFEKNYKKLELNKISNLKELSDRLKTKEKEDDFAKLTGIDSKYLTVLRRLVNSFIPKPVPVRNFPDLKTGDIKKLENAGLKNSKQIYESLYSGELRSKLSVSLKIPVETINEIYVLCGLSRIWGVGPIFARLIRKAGINSAKEFSECDSLDLYNKVLKINKEGNYTSSHFSENDLRFCVEFSKQIIDL